MDGKNNVEGLKDTPQNTEIREGERQIWMEELRKMKHTIFKQII